MDEMTAADANMPATRTELDGLGVALRSDMAAMGAALRSDMKTMELAIRADMKAMETGIRTDMGAMIDRVAMEVMKTQAHVQRLEERMDGLMTKEDGKRILDAIDAFSGKAQSYDRAAALHGHSLTELEIQVKDHEQRIKHLEGNA